MNEIITDLEKQYQKFSVDFVNDEMKNGFSRLDAEHLRLLDAYSISTMQQLCGKINGLASSGIYNIILEELRLSARVGYTLHSSYDRYSLEQPEFKGVTAEPVNKFSIKKVINNILDTLKVR